GTLQVYGPSTPSRRECGIRIAPGRTQPSERGASSIEPSEAARRRDPVSEQPGLRHREHAAWRVGVESDVVRAAYGPGSAFQLKTSAVERLREKRATLQKQQVSRIHIQCLRSRSDERSRLCSIKRAQHVEAVNRPAGSTPCQVDEMSAVGEKVRERVCLLTPRLIDPGDRRWRPTVCRDPGNATSVGKENDVVSVPCAARRMASLKVTKNPWRLTQETDGLQLIVGDEPEIQAV